MKSPAWKTLALAATMVLTAASGCHFHAHIHLPGSQALTTVEIGDEISERKQNEPGSRTGRTLWDSLDPRDHKRPNRTDGGDGNLGVDRDRGSPRLLEVEPQVGDGDNRGQV